MKPTKTQDPLAVLAALNAAIAPPPAVLPDGFKTVKEWSELWGIGVSGTERKLRKACNCGHFRRVLVRMPVGTNAFAYGPA